MTKEWIKIHEENIENRSSDFNFWSGIRVWIERPHILNRKLLAVKILKAWKSSHLCLDSRTLELLENGDFSFESIIKYLGIVACKAKSELFNWQQISEDKDNLIIFRKLLPRNLHRFTEVSEVIVLDQVQGYAAFFPKKVDVHSSSITPAFPYRLKLSEKEIYLETYKSSDEICMVDQLSEKWLKASVVPKVVNWCQNLPKKAILPSLTLVPPEKYNMNYHYLKTKYGKKFVEIWPERSDPLKYVYEDISIAAYLITLWDEERMCMTNKKQRFIDLGCGNGLLVNILSSEGYQGIGIDVRKRKIWDLYGPETTLIEKTVEPSDRQLFPDYDWIIGNHSDELTPWIPVIAARSSYEMKVFLLPCCPFTFNGKYDRSYPGCTQYESYLTFISDLCKAMGFKVQQDKLRIPSTKRICFVCMSRSYNQDQEKEIDNNRMDFINSNSKKPVKISGPFSISNNDSSLSPENQMDVCPENDNWIANFKPRKQFELIRNCSNFDKKFVEDTIITILNILLRTENYIPVNNSKSILWNSGGQINIADLVKLMDSSVLKQMKNHCGGFQTFLRNHKEVFQIENCVVQIKRPFTDTSVYETTKKRDRRCRMMKKLPLHEKKCFFHFHHPQGCPLSTSDCRFSHDRD